MMALRLLVTLMPLLALAGRVVQALLRERTPIIAGVIIGMALGWTTWMRAAPLIVWLVDLVLRPVMALVTLMTASVVMTPPARTVARLATAARLPVRGHLAVSLTWALASIRDGLTLLALARTLQRSLVEASLILVTRMMSPVSMTAVMALTVSPPLAVTSPPVMARLRAS